MKLQGRVVPEKNLRRVLNSASPGIDELLNEHLAIHPICFFPEDGAEYDGHAVVAGLDVDGLLLAVVDRLDLAALADTLRCFLRRELGRLLPQVVVLLVSLLKRRGHDVALQEGDLVHEFVTRIC